MTWLPVAIGIVIVLLFFYSKFFGDWRVMHQRIIGLFLIAYSAYLATLTGTVTQFVVPGVGAIGVGAAAGAGIGFISWLVLGTVGVATGGVGIAAGAMAMTLVGGVLSAIGAASGGAGFKTVSYPLISPFFWGPLLLLGVYFILGARKKKATQIQIEKNL